MIDVNSFYYGLGLIAVSFVAVWVFSRMRHRLSDALVTERDKQQVASGFLIVLLSGFAISVLSIRPANPLQAIFTGWEFGEFFFYFVVVVIPVLLAVRLLRAGPSIARLGAGTLPFSCVLGSVTFLILTIPSTLFSSQFTSALIGISALYLANHLFAAFSEELLFRGLLQRPLEAWIGSWKGIWLTSIVFSFWHFPALILAEGKGAGSALVALVPVIPISLLLGYVASKSDNILAPTLCHFAYDLPLLLLR